ncbi:hypothetical protein evm_001896 [Chilo suppressalis]|nr:hypothetical protein evm_001896 [Chilo suppressalis]
MKPYLILMFIVIVSVTACKDRLTTVQIQNFDAPTYIHSPILQSCDPPNIQDTRDYDGMEYVKHVLKQNVPISQYSSTSFVPQAQVKDTEYTCVTKHSSAPISSNPNIVPLSLLQRVEHVVDTKFVQGVENSELQLSNLGSYYTDQSSFVPHIWTKSQPDLVPCTLECVRASKHGPRNQHAYSFECY